MTVSGSNDTSTQILIQYKNHNQFSAFYKENNTDPNSKTIVEDVEVKVNPEKDGELIFTTSDRQFKMGFLVKPDNDP